MHEERSEPTAFASKSRLFCAAGGCSVVMLVLTSTGLAAEFDPGMKAPPEASASELKAEFEEIFDDIENPEVAMSTILRNRDQHAKFFDLKWRINRAIDARKPLGDLEAVGMKAREDGGFDFDLERFPQWYSLEQKIVGAFRPARREGTFEALRHRGFREADIHALRDYVEQNNPDLLVAEDAGSLTESFARRTRQRAVAGRVLTEAEMAAYGYQMNKHSAEVMRAWAAGVLDSLDRQRQRILESYLTLEIHYRRSVGPSGQAADKDSLKDWLLTGEYVAAHEQQRRNAQRWTRKSEN